MFVCCILGKQQNDQNDLNMTLASEKEDVIFMVPF